MAQKVELGNWMLSAALGGAGGCSESPFNLKFKKTKSCLYAFATPLLNCIKPRSIRDTLMMMQATLVLASSTRETASQRCETSTPAEPPATQQAEFLIHARQSLRQEAPPRSSTSLSVLRDFCTRAGLSSRQLGTQGEQTSACSLLQRHTFGGHGSASPSA